MASPKVLYVHLGIVVSRDKEGEYDKERDGLSGMPAPIHQSPTTNMHRRSQDFGDEMTKKDDLQRKAMRAVRLKEIEQRALNEAYSNGYNQGRIVRKKTAERKALNEAYSKGYNQGWEDGLK